MVERRPRERGACAIRELFHRPVLQSRLLIVEEDTPILDAGRAVRAASRCHKDLGVLCCRNVRPP